MIQSPTVPDAAPPADSSAMVRGRIVKLARAASYEVSARDAKGLDAAMSLLVPGTQVSVTWLPQDGDDHRVEAARRLRDAGFEPIPHIAARMIADQGHIERLLGRLCDVGVRQLLVVSGDVKQAAGPFADSGALIAGTALARAPLRQIWVGGYPEGHPRIADAPLRATLDAKIAAIRALGLDAGVITQFCFDAQPILGWMHEFRARHREVPVRIGLAWPAGIRTLLRYAAICGVGSSAKAIVSRGASIARLLSDAAPDPIIRDLAETAAFHDLEPMGFHLFPFGGLARTARWMGAVAAGGFRLRDSESGFQAEI